MYESVLFYTILLLNKGEKRHETLRFNQQRVSEDVHYWGESKFNIAG